MLKQSSNNPQTLPELLPGRSQRPSGSSILFRGWTVPMGPTAWQSDPAPCSTSRNQKRRHQRCAGNPGLWHSVAMAGDFYCTTFLPFLSIFGQIFFIINGNGSSLNAMLDEQRLPRIRTNQQGYQPDPGPFVRCQ